MPNKAELIAAIAEQAGISGKDAGAALDAMVSEITGALKTGERVAIPGFGTFSVGSYPCCSSRTQPTNGCDNSDSCE